MRALITGITGQDGSYLAEFLLENSADGRKMANDVCHSLEVAKQVAQDDSKPKPLIFLAQIAVKELE